MILKCNTNAVVLMSAIVAMTAGGASGLSAAATRADNGIYIVGALHGLHETEESFDYAELKNLIEAIDPDVMLLEVRPDELAGRKDTPGRPEYPAVIWPMIAESGSTAVGMEPGDALFTKMVTDAGNRAAAFERDYPDEHAFWTSYGRSLVSALTEHWSELAQTHDDITGDLMRGRYIVHAAIAGESAAEGQKRWDAYMVEQARLAINANPDGKILVLGSYRNRHVFVEALSVDFADRVVDMEQWLGENE